MANESGGENKGKWSGSCQGPAGGLYGLGFIGAAVYYIERADNFWVGLAGVLKALVWPAFLVYRLLEFLGR